MAKNSTAVKLISGLFGSKAEKTEQAKTFIPDIENLKIPTAKAEDSVKVESTPKHRTSGEAEREEETLRPRRRKKERRKAPRVEMSEDDAPEPVNVQEHMAPEADIPVCADNGTGNPFAGLKEKLAHTAPEVPVETPQELETPDDAAQMSPEESLKAAESMLERADAKLVEAEGMLTKAKTDAETAKVAQAKADADAKTAKVAQAKADADADTAKVAQAKADADFKAAVILIHQMNKIAGDLAEERQKLDAKAAELAEAQAKLDEAAKMFAEAAAAELKARKMRIVERAHRPPTPNKKPAFEIARRTPLAIKF